ncbi:hypothetical protein M8C21_010820 [Ambrosia artemisiifolia]|uniref:Uncharacterized protein n=1 Tax=Ambrosia artemisiifolia TaxID=4212 RepID=A0AAD5CTR0_AMBAR|nr:hypothetical protein M8C21_010820 [Ambrosia artemisiifolia]
MAPKKPKHELTPKKIKLPKDSKIKLKKKKKVSSTSNAAATAATVSCSDNRGVDTEWWISFWEKNPPLPGSMVPEDEEEGFKYFFRVSKKTFEYICSLVREDLISRPPSGLINIEGRLLSVEKQVAIALRRLASGESQVSKPWKNVAGTTSNGQITIN